MICDIQQATRPIPKARTEESMLDEEEAESDPDADKREQAIAKRSEARVVSTMIVLI